VLLHTFWLQLTPTRCCCMCRLRADGAAVGRGLRVPEEGRRGNLGQVSAPAHSANAANGTTAKLPAWLLRWF